MAHGTPDWWGTEPTATTHKVSDMGELAARLGSIVTFDRRGDVVWLSGFENGLAEFTKVRISDESNRNISTEAAYMGAYSLKLIIGSNTGDMSGIEKWLAYPALSKFGGEFAFTWHTDLDYLDVFFYFYDGINRTEFTIRFSDTNKKIYYLDSGGNLAEIDNLPAWVTTKEEFEVAKLVVDLEAGEYVRLILNNISYPLTGILGKVTSVAVRPMLIFAVRAYGPGATTPTIYLDNLIITQNEP
jgi:hypothetical protein